ncbi:NAD(P)H-dependent oxidoreductase [Ilyomonas limi]|uniref:NAD(P)H-dependent oxidoreductase n=1 Tax=Ilyomonas limi TaxID=2575867 RepID=A0A4U3L8W4_9BACT|nr:nitroreductase family protein [Ilyomonas limi]TKK71718.1 NAD(P)H-dependent oxidoreductase [Ilyomonas limi]
MELIKSLEWRYASKKMNGKKVSQEKVDNILKAIQLAPSSMGLQPYTILVITNPGIKKQILPIANNQSQIVDSSHLLVFAAWADITPGQIDEYIAHTAKTRNVPEETLAGFKNTLLNIITKKTTEENYQWAARQAYIAFGTAIAAAAEERVDATPMEGFNATALDALLGLKEKGLRSVTLLPLGYRDTGNDWLANLPKVRRQREKLFIQH